MGFFDSLFGSSGTAYPTTRTGPVVPGCGGGPFVPPERDGLFNKLFAPADLAYPLPPCTRPASTTPPSDPRLTTVASSSNNTGAASAAPTAPAASAAPTATAAPVSAPVAAAAAAAPAVPVSAPPVTVVFAPWPGVQSLPPGAPAAQSVPAMSTEKADGDSQATATTTAAPMATTTSAPAPASAPTPASAPPPTTTSAPAPAAAAVALVTLPQPCDANASKLLRAYVFNPEIAPSVLTAQEAYLAEVLGEGEPMPSRLVSRDGTPVAFVVPDGCDSMDLLYGPIEVNPGCGCDADLDQIVLTGEAKLSANVGGVDRPLEPGEQVIVTVPWRAAAWVSLPAGRLRMQVQARFYKSQSK